MTSLVHSVVFVGLTSIVEPPSSNSNSSAVEAYWRMGSTFWALPVFPTPCILTH